MDLQIVDPTEIPNWDQILLNTPGYTFFHSSAWARVLKESYGYGPKYFAKIGSGEILTLLPVMEIRSLLTGCRGVSLPFTDYCEPILGRDMSFQELFNEVVRFARERGWNYIELRGGHNLLPRAPSRINYFGHTLDISRDEESVFKGFRGSTKRNIKKAIEECVEVKIDHSFDFVKEFYRLNCLTRRKHGLPPQPFKFFKKIFQWIVSQKDGFISLASFGGRYIAGAMFFQFGDEAIFKYGASDKKYQYLRPNNLVMWQAIRRLCQNGCGKIHFGRTETNNLGLLQFKAGWGAKPASIKYYRYELNREEFVENGGLEKRYSSNRAINRMPIAVARIVGSILYKHVG